MVGLNADIMMDPVPFLFSTVIVPLVQLHFSVPETVVNVTDNKFVFCPGVSGAKHICFLKKEAEPAGYFQRMSALDFFSKELWNIEV